jgi:hypothetical protein
LIGLLIALIPFLFFPLMTGWCAQSLNRKFWPWFIAGCFLPFIGIIILFCLPIKENKNCQQAMRPVANEEIFDHLLDEEKSRHINDSAIQYSARA